ncbi:unnamed protein product [Fusarium fujikuroi]|nr:unnamed protein product [Fusarium fujikuroi]
MAATKTEIALELVRTRSDISSTEKEINDIKWAIIQVQTQQSAAQAIVTGNYPHDRIVVAQQQVAEFIDKENELYRQQNRSRAELQRLKAKETRLQHQLQAKCALTKPSSNDGMRDLIFAQ